MVSGSPISELWGVVDPILFNVYTMLIHNAANPIDYEGCPDIKVSEMFFSGLGLGLSTRI